MTGPSRLKTVLLSAAALACAVGGPLRAETVAPISPPAADEAGETLTRTITLTEAGFADGVAFSGLSGRREFFFPVSQGVAGGAVLRLHYEAGAAEGVRRNLQVAVGDRVIAALPLAAGAAADTVEIPLPAGAATGGFVRFALIYSGAATGEVCMDERVAGDFLTILPQSGVTLSLAAPLLADPAVLAALAPAATDIVLPDRALSESEAAAALSLASLYRADRGQARVIAASALPPAEAGARDWRRNTVLVGAAEDFPTLILEAGARRPDESAGAVLAGWMDGRPALLLTGGRPDHAARLLAGRWRALARATALGEAGDEAGASVKPMELPLSAFGADLAAADVAGRGVFAAALPARALPPGTRAATLALDLAVAPDAAGEGATVSVFLNDVLLAARPARQDRVHMDVALPEPLLGLDNGLRVVVQRSLTGGECARAAQALPAQILPSSRVRLSAQDGPGGARDFHDLPSLFAGRVHVALDAFTAEGVAAAAPFVAALAAPDAPITAGPDAAGHAAFIAVGPAAPDGARAPARLDGGAVEAVLADGAPLLAARDLAGLTAAQLVRTPAGAGLWVRPGAAAVTPGADGLGLDRGDVAFLDGGVLTLAFHTRGDEAVALRAPDARNWLAMADGYRPWVIGGLWLAVTLAFAAILQRAFRRRQGADQ